MTTLLNSEVPIEVRAIALEANVLGNMATAMKNMFPNLVGKVKNVFSNFTRNTYSDLKLDSVQHQKFVLKEIGAFSYTDVSELSTIVPEGFIGEYLEYIKHLKDLMVRMENLKDNVLIPYRSYISVFTTNKDAKISTKDETFVFDALKESRDEQIKATGKFFKKGSFEANTKMRQVFKRIGDIRPVIEESNELLKRLNVIDIKDIKSNVDQSVAILDGISKGISSDKIETISPEAARNLAEGAYEIAREVEYFVVCYYNVRSYLVSFDYTVEKLNRFIRGER